MEQLMNGTSLVPLHPLDVQGIVTGRFDPY